MRTFVIGDPQAPFAKVQEVLDRHGLLAGDALASDVVLVSIGDHFDYDLHDPTTAGLEGLRLLRWLASHDPSQVRIVFGNHDAARVMELAKLTDDGFAAARALARAIEAGTRTEAEFRAAYPELPPSGVIGRDYASFSIEQRALVIELLLAGRFHLALVGELEDRRQVLMTHAGVTTREHGMLNIVGRSREPRMIAAALEAHLHAAVERVRCDWQRGVPTPLSLEPLHVSGGKGLEGGGLLYHRPSNPATGSRFEADRPRRFDPRALVPGLEQIAGHSGHAKCVYELGAWCSESARARKHGGIRTLIVSGEQVRYELGVVDDEASTARLILVDGELRRVPVVEVALLRLAIVR